MSGKGTVEFFKFNTSNPEELQSIVSQKFTPIERLEPRGKEFHADYRAYAVGQLIITRDKFLHGISVIPIPEEKWLFLELPLRGKIQLEYRGKDIYVDQNSPYLIATDEPIHYRFQENTSHTTIGIDKQMLNAYAQKLVNGQQELKFIFWISVVINGELNKLPPRTNS